VYIEQKEILMKVVTNYEDTQFSTSLNDNNLNTEVEFPFVEGTTNKVQITFTTGALDGENITATGIQFTPSPNVTLPKTIAIKITTPDGSGYQTVMAETNVTGTRMSFPETKAETFLVEFGLIQPLRLSEIKLLQKPQTIERSALRFLAQPGEKYTIYIDPDRNFGNFTQETVNLSNNRDVLKILEEGYASSQINTMYVPSDRDGDGVPDTEDNCPEVPNTDQIDVNNNGQGDVCDDFDRDGIMTIKDNCPETPNRDQRDTDGDGKGDACDTEENRFTERSPWIPWAGMGIAVIVLVGLLALSVRRPSQQKSSTDTESQKKDEEKDVVDETKVSAQE
jgi:hypothetical protein